MINRGGGVQTPSKRHDIIKEQPLMALLAIRMSFFGELQKSVNVSPSSQKSAFKLKRKKINMELINAGNYKIIELQNNLLKVCHLSPGLGQDNRCLVELGWDKGTRIHGWVGKFVVIWHTCRG